MIAGLFRGQDRRRETRIGVNLPAVVLPGHHRCMVKDLSEGGCRLQLAQPSRLPDSLVVVLLDKGVAHQGVVRWRETDQVGLKFERSADLRGMVPSVFIEAKALWLRGGKA
jgi:hypothetical protein